MAGIRVKISNRDYMVPVNTAIGNVVKLPDNGHYKVISRYPLKFKPVEEGSIQKNDVVLVAEKF